VSGPLLLTILILLLTLRITFSLTGALVRAVCLAFWMTVTAFALVRFFGA
jgi:hypothetical protein